jgi:amidase
LRIAFTTEAQTGPKVHPDCAAAVRDAAALCAELGHDVEEATPPILGEFVVDPFITVWCAGGAMAVEGLALVTGRAATPDDFETVTWALYQKGRGYSASQYLVAVTLLQMVSRQIARFMEEYDLWLSPTLADPPLRLGSFDSTPENPLKGFERAEQHCPFTPIANFTGQPAMSVPLFWNGEGLPIGAHFTARFGDEATLFRLASQLEQARPWAQRRPPISA